MHSFDDKVGGGIRASAETAAKERGMNLNFFRGQAGNLRGVGAINGFELRARPDFATIGTQVYDAIQRLYHGVREVRNIVLGGHGLRSGCQSSRGIACLFRDGSW